MLLNTEGKIHQWSRNVNQELLWWNCVFILSIKEEKREKARTSFFPVLSQNLSHFRKCPKREKEEGRKGGREGEDSPPPISFKCLSNLAGSVQMFQLCPQLMSYHLSVTEVGFLFCKRTKLIDKHCLLLTYSLRTLGWLMCIWEVVLEVCESPGSKGTRYM